MARGFGQLLGCGLAAMLAVAGGQAGAIEQGGSVVPPGTATCAATSYASGIRYLVNPIIVNVGAPAGQNAAVTIGDAGGGHGIELGSLPAAGAQVLNVGDNVTITQTNADRDGIRIVSDTGPITATVAGTINASGFNSNGIFVRSASGTVRLDVSADITLTGGSDGLADGAINVNLSSGSVTVNQSGAISTTASASVGLLLQGGSAVATVNGTINTLGAAIAVIAFNGGGNHITVNGSVTAQLGSGVLAFTGNAMTGSDVVVNGSVVAEGADARGVTVAGGASSTITVGANGLISGGSGALGAGVFLSAEAVGGASALINGGTVRALSDAAVVSNALRLTDDAIRNSGDIIGFVQLFEGADSFDNQAGGRWFARGGQVSFGDGTDTLINHAGALIAIDGTQSWSDLESFANAGRLSLQEVDGGAQDVDPAVFSSFTYMGSFQGQGGVIALDTELAGDGAPSDVVILQGSVAGSGLVAINNVGGAGQGTSGDGILVVDASGAMGDLSLTLAQPVIVGATQYNLVEDASRWFLRSGAFAGAGDYPILLSSALVAWHAGLGPLHERLAALRQAAGAGTEQTAAVGASDLAQGGRPGHGRLTGGGWAKAYWSDLAVDPAKGTAFDQEGGGLQAGFDLGLRDVAAAGDRLLGGLFVGSFGSEARIDGGSSVSLDGFTLGGYVTYLQGGLHLDGVLKLDFAEADFEQPSSLTRAESEVTTWGLSLEAGWRFPLGGTLYLEPSAQIAWAEAAADDFVGPGAAEVDLRDGSSLRGRLGLRGGGSFELGGGGWLAPYLELGVQHEVLGESEAVTTGSHLVSDLAGTAGQVGGGLEVISADGRLALVLDLDYGFGGTAEGIELAVAARFNW